jgi:hypothetical protein
MSFINSLFGLTPSPVNPKISEAQYRKAFKDKLGPHTLKLANKPLVIIPEKMRYEHSMVMGRSGAGKTVLLQTMYAQDILSGAGMIFVDPKNDQFSFIQQLAQKANRVHQLHSIQLTAQDSETWNPLYGDDPSLIANRLHEALYADAGPTAVDFYKSVGLAILRDVVTLLMAYGKKINLSDLYHVLRFPDLLKKVVNDFKGNPKYYLAVNNLTVDLVDAEKAAAKQLLIGLCNKFQPLVTSSWSPFVNTYDPNIIIQKIIDEGEILHFGVASEVIGKEAYQPLIRLFLSEVKEAVGIRYGKGFKKPCFFYVDEFGDVASDQFIDGLKKFRSAGIGFLIGFQSLADLKRRGEPFMIDVIQNCATRIFYNLPEAETADYTAKLIGTYEKRVTSAQSSDSSGAVKGQTLKLDNRTFKIPVDILKNLAIGDAVIACPFQWNKEYAVFKFRSIMLKSKDFPEADNEFYQAFWKNLPKEEHIGLNLKNEVQNNQSKPDKPVEFNQLPGAERGTAPELTIEDQTTTEISIEQQGTSDEPTIVENTNSLYDDLINKINTAPKRVHAELKNRKSISKPRPKKQPLNEPEVK